MKSLIWKLVRRPLNKWLWLKISTLIETKLLTLMGINLIVKQTAKDPEVYFYFIKLRDAWVGGLALRF